MIDTIQHHITAFWLQSLHQIAATRNALRADGSVESPELDRLHRTAVRNFAHASIGRSYDDFDDASAWAADLAIISGRTMAVTRLTKHDFRAKQTTEFAVFADSMIPDGPGYVRVETITRFDAI